MTQVDLDIDIVVTLERAEPILTHIIDRGDDPRTAEAIVLEARIMGQTLTALCGHKFIPSRNVQKHPVCDKCIEMFEFARDFRNT